MGPLKGRRSARTGGKRYELTWKEKIWIFSLPSQSGCISDGDDSINIWKIYVLGPNHEKRFCAWAWQELGKRFTSDGLDICVNVYISWITSISKSVMIDWKQRPLYPVLRIGCSLWDYWITPQEREGLFKCVWDSVYQRWFMWGLVPKLHWFTTK